MGLDMQTVANPKRYNIKLAMQTLNDKDYLDWFNLRFPV